VIYFHVEPLEAAWPEIMALAAQHWMETEEYRHGQGFKPVFARYDEYAKCGWMFVVMVRDEGRAIGYSAMYVTPSMHTQKLIATEDTFFLEPAYRGKGLASDFVSFVENECVKRGAVEVVFTAKAVNHVGAILEHLDYVPVAVQYSKQLRCADSAFPSTAVTEKSIDPALNSKNSQRN
jgi:GNAT superfamily N-acetyltransferase